MSGRSCRIFRRNIRVAELLRRLLLRLLDLLPEPDTFGRLTMREVEAKAASGQMTMRELERWVRVAKDAASIDERAAFVRLFGEQNPG